MPPQEPNIVGEVPVVNRIVGSSTEGQVVGTAKVEKLPGGNLMVHIDASEMTGDMLRGGFSLEHISMRKSGKVCIACHEGNCLIHRNETAESFPRIGFGSDGR